MKKQNQTFAREDEALLVFVRLELSYFPNF